jgi:hypothetical protein
MTFIPDKIVISLGKTSVITDKIMDVYRQKKKKTTVTSYIQKYVNETQLINFKFWNATGDFFSRARDNVKNVNHIYYNSLTTSLEFFKNESKSFIFFWPSKRMLLQHTSSAVHYSLIILSFDTI